MTRRLSQVLDPQLITLNVRSTQRSDALSEVARLLEGHSDVVDFDVVVAVVVENVPVVVVWVLVVNCPVSVEPAGSMIFVPV